MAARAVRAAFSRGRPRGRRLSAAAGSDGGGQADEVDAQLSVVLARVRDQLGDVQGVKTPGPKSLLRFTCSHAGCALPEGERTSTKVISQKAYREGVVLVQCNCSRLHLIADRLGWFGENADIESILASKGEAVVRRMVREDALQLSD
ncbi:hypothetical protein KFE25_011383 [Diacronema lutheri]|uniref:DNL-type domain-containing protein n=1 Tax=Diacronema lutheri TaxID=2081491 RepID=A0A8J5X6R2_DIALT|nr:hypothetical protein KFE25_011383 [Diacronema lutheri]